MHLSRRGDREEHAAERAHVQGRVAVVLRDRRALVRRTEAQAAALTEAVGRAGLGAVQRAAQQQGGLEHTGTTEPRAASTVAPRTVHRLAGTVQACNVWAAAWMRTAARCRI